MDILFMAGVFKLWQRVGEDISALILSFLNVK